MAINPSELLIKNAEAFAAGKVLGMTEDEVLSRLEYLSERKNTSDASKLNEAFLDDAVKGRFDALETAPSGRQLLVEARRKLSRAGARKNATPEQRSQAMQEAIQESLRAEIFMEKAKREDPSRILGDANASMPDVVKSLEAAGLEGSDGADTAEESMFTRLRTGGGGDYDEQGNPLYDVDPNEAAAIRRNTFRIGDDTVTFREDELIPYSLRTPGVERQLDKETYSEGHPSLNRRVAGGFDEAAVFSSAPYSDGDNFNAYLVRDEEGNVIRYSRDATGNVVPDPNGTITVKRVLSGDDTVSYEPVINPTDGTITGARVIRGEVVGRPQKTQVDDIGVGTSQRPRINPQQAAVLTEIAARAVDGSLPSNVSVSSGFQDPRFRDTPLSVTGVISSGAGEPSTAENMYYRKNPSGGVPIRVYPSMSADGQLVGDEAIRITQGGELDVDSGRIFRDELYKRGRATADANGPRVVLSSDRGTPVSAEVTRRLNSQQDISRLMGRKEMMYAPNPGEGVTFSRDVADDVVYIDDAGNYFDPISGETYGQNTPDSVVIQEMERYTPEGIEATRRARRVGEILGSIRSTTGKKGQKPKILTNDEENFQIAQQLGVSIPEAVELKEAFKREAGMGQSPQAFVRDLVVPSMSSGDYPQVDVGASLQRLTNAVNRVLPAGETIAPIRTSQQAYEALRLYQQLDRTQRPSAVGAGIRDLTGVTRLPTIREDNYTPTVEEVVTSRIQKRDQLKRVVDTMKAEGLGTGENGAVTFLDIKNNTGLDTPTVQAIAQAGKEADSALEQINAVGIENAQLSESILQETSTPVQGGYLETVGMMEEFKDPTARKELGYALKQLELAEGSGRNQDRKDLFVDTGRTLIDGEVGTNRVEESTKIAQMFETKGGGAIALERDARQPYPSVITADGQRLEPGFRKDGKPRAVAAVPVRRNADGTPLDVQTAVGQERDALATKSWMKTPEADREARIARFTAKQRNAANFETPEAETFTGVNLQSDESNAGLTDANLLEGDRSRTAATGGKFLAQQAAPLTNEAESLAKLRAERGNLDAGLPREPVLGLSSTPTPPGRPTTPEEFFRRRGTAPSQPQIQVSLEDAGRTMQDLAVARETAERFAIPGSNPRTIAYTRAASKPEAQLPPVSRPSGSNNEVVFAIDPNGVKIPLGKGYAGANTMLDDPNANATAVARAQAPVVSTPSIGVEQPPSKPRQPEPPAGEPGGSIILRELQSRKGKQQAQNRRNPFTRRNVGIGAAAAGGATLAGVGISDLINNEREQREERN